ncbi:alpha/beta hydrolase [Bradyrhizobium sp. LHD-71]|uniref:alpha/beta fold hydrolase n=1 Tax=Bradyrhizobium sp. LHD-71 TaxID=3072141 RepID=UPI0028103C66|nr:alpha/beta hydrolase [Bradyrhizobium sp. LHD-71]MDQ8728606.1 alpha/beta hydrolase [Bradyrhizobium sp. LHD-71]
MTEVPYSSPQLAKANGIEICYDTFGLPDAEPLLLIMGLSAQMVLWDDEFCQQLASRGFRVIRFDNRDIGHSTKMSGGGGKRITVTEFLKLRFFGILPWAPYTLRDMADDTVGLMDALGIRTAHVVGASMGGAIAQEVAIHHPERVSSLTSIMSTTGNLRLPQPKREAMALLMSPPPRTKDQYIATFARNWKILRAGRFPLDEAKDRERAERCYARGLNPAGVARQFRAILASGARNKALASVRAPSLVIHGAADPLVRPEAGVDTARSIPGAKLLMIEGMGHAMPIPLWPQIIDAIADHAHAATKQAA